MMLRGRILACVFALAVAGAALLPAHAGETFRVRAAEHD